MKLKNYFLLFTIIAFIFSCKPEISADMKKVEDLKEEYKQNPNKETAAAYVAAVTLYNSTHPKTDESKAYLEDAKKIATDQKQAIVSAGITNELIKSFPNDPKTKEYLTSLATELESIGKKQAAFALKYFYMSKYPNDPASKEYKKELGELPSDPTTYLKTKAQSIFEDVDNVGLNRKAAFEYVDASEAYVLVNPKDQESPEYLFKAAEIAKTIGTFKKSLSLYDWIIANYPGDDKAPTAMFLKAFILEDNVNNIEAARIAYEEFIEKYPDHHFVDDAQFSLKNLGKSSEEIQAELEKLQQQNPPSEK